MYRMRFSEPVLPRLVTFVTLLALLAATTGASSLLLCCTRLSNHESAQATTACCAKEHDSDRPSNTPNGEQDAEQCLLGCCGGWVAMASIRPFIHALGLGTTLPAQAPSVDTSPTAEGPFQPPRA